MKLGNILIKSVVVIGPMQTDALSKKAVQTGSPLTPIVRRRFLRPILNYRMRHNPIIEKLSPVVLIVNLNQPALLLAVLVRQHTRDMRMSFSYAMVYIVQ